jgi:hypothetical protein
MGIKIKEAYKASPIRIAHIVAAKNIIEGVASYSM